MHIFVSQQIHFRGSVVVSCKCLEHEGPIPESFSLLQNLEELWLNGNRLSGIIPEGLGHLPHLRELYLNANELVGGIPSSFGELASLEGLNLGWNQLSGGFPASLGNMVRFFQFAFAVLSCCVCFFHTARLSPMNPEHLGRGHEACDCGPPLPLFASGARVGRDIPAASTLFVLVTQFGVYLVYMGFVLFFHPLEYTTGPPSRENGFSLNATFHRCYCQSHPVTARC